MLAALAGCSGSPGASSGQSSTQASPSASSTVPAVAPHIAIVVMENREFGQIIGNQSAPTLNALADRYGLATNAYSIRHPSLPNYLELISGSTQGVEDDGTGYLFDGPTLADQLYAHGIGWRAYMGGLPDPCFTGDSSDAGYAKKHDPFMYFRSVTTRASQCAQIVPLDDLAGDLAGGTAPPFLWISPSLCDDGHDCGTDRVDGFVAHLVAALQSSSWYAQGGTLIITWDEGVSNAGCCGRAHGGGHIAVIVAAEHLAGSRESAPVDHAGVLRSIEQLYGVPELGDAGCTCSGDLLRLLRA